MTRSWRFLPAGVWRWRVSWSSWALVSDWLGELVASFLMRFFRQVLGTVAHRPRSCWEEAQLFPALLHSRQTSFLFPELIDWSGVTAGKPYSKPFLLLALAIGSCCLGRRVYTRNRFCWSKSGWIKWLLPQPHHPHRFQNLALSVEPGVAHTSST